MIDLSTVLRSAFDSVPHVSLYLYMTVNNIPSCLRDLPDAILSALHNTGRAEVSFSKINSDDLEDLWTLGGIDFENGSITVMHLLTTALLSGGYTLSVEWIDASEYQDEKSIVIIFTTPYISSKRLTIPRDLKPQLN